MEARRFSRVNSLQTASPDDPKGERFGGKGRPAVEPKGKPAADNGFPQSGDTESPAWQEYFFLAPNVRFTRTPDYEPKPRPEHEAVVEQNGTKALPTQQARPGVVVHPSPQSAGSVQPERTGEKMQGLALAAAMAPATGRTATRPAPVVGKAAPGQAATPEKARRPYLSDHAFFEGLAPHLVDVTAPARPVGPTSRASTAVSPVTAGRVEIPAPVPGDVTALFRVIECLPGQASPVSPEVLPANSNEAVVQPNASASRAARQARAPAAIAPVAKNSAVPAPIAKSVEETAPIPAVRASPALPMAGKIGQPATGETYELPSEELLQQPPEGQGFYMSQERLEQNADLLESVLEDFGVRGEIIHVRPGPVVTLYEFEPAPGVKSSRVIGLADDIARSMSAVSARVAVVPGRNVIGIELPNETRETVYFRELIESEGFRKTGCKLALCLGKTIGGEPVIAELAKMPHLLVAGTTGSGKSVAINTMILSLLYRLRPEECRLIMVDPKMLELSVYDGIPHLLTPVVTDPKKAVTALKWAVREMEDRYRKMARLGVRNIDGYNQRAAQARDKGETVVMTVQTGFEKGTGEPLFEQQEIDLAPMPYIVVIVDEMADLMMVAGKEIEGAIQRLAQMARAAGIHLIMATQRPSVDVITGTIKANFPTRISFQVTSKIDSRTILGEQGAEQLLGQGDMLHMMGGGRIARVHGPFVSDAEVEHVVAHLKAQGRPEYLETVTADEEDEEEVEADQGAVFDKGSVASEDNDSLYDEAVKVVVRDKKCSTSYIQRRLGVGYNRAASLVERMEKEGLVGAPNHVGKREIIMGRRPPVSAPEDDSAD
ncbi:MAG: DNA translocase FtsK [Mesorhizobium sp.]|nr:DNA translocase FtsK [bacterium M00.F.Ca.ET.205.01.1.1]TGU55058.1 DNA translocase FtsK [bacterium M00.F.Ca.ET.152.01.1.1]TGV38292.1 DNA translocase FtsK [Mesorhizobium sp. M00.F.Ca.ET.186.01.1.1]TGZ44512.1 DNA translocase FtsK [bacterium M00.F.Ca.ET.162.01.1.1]TIW61858.1 MAG: DNA translocase FtsK [Mesorhizobium sp.]